MRTRTFLFFMVILVWVSNSDAKESFLLRFKNIFFTHEHCSRHYLYQTIVDNDGVHIEESLRADLVDNQEYYLDMIEESILKREQNGSKEGKIVDVPKIIYGSGQLSMPVIGYYLLQHYQLDYGKLYTVPSALIMCGLGLKNLYKGIFYKSRMEQKLERDKLTRRFIREVNSQI